MRIFHYMRLFDYQIIKMSWAALCDAEREYLLHGDLNESTLAYYFAVIDEVDRRWAAGMRR